MSAAAATGGSSPAADLAAAGRIGALAGGGISHPPLEWTDPADCAPGERVLAATVRRLAA